MNNNRIEVGDTVAVYLTSDGEYGIHGVVQYAPMWPHDYWIISERGKIVYVQYFSSMTLDAKGE